MASTPRTTFAMAIATLALAAAPSAAVAQDTTPTPTPTPEPQHLTAKGVLLSIQDDLQALQQTNPDGTVTHCQVAGGTIRTQSGDVNFGVGGVVTPSGTLAPPVQEAYHTLLDSERRGSAVITRVNYDSPSSICGYPGNVVTSVSLEEVAPPAPPPAPPTPPGPPLAPKTTQTVSGIVTRVSPFGQLVSNGQSNCKVWPSTIRTTSGQEINFAVQTPLSGSLAGGGLNPTDPNAAPRAQLIETAFLRKAFTTITITGPVNACGLNLPAVVTDVNVQLPPLKNSTMKGRVLRISAGSNFSGNGESCKAWKGVLKTTSGKRIRFSVVTKTQNGQAVSANAPKTAKALKKAKEKGERAQATITYQAGSANACGRKFTNPVNKAKVKTKRPEHRYSMYFAWPWRPPLRVLPGRNSL